MNINRLQKKYDKLSEKERFALLIAAQSRGDDQEYDALIRSAPRKNFSVPNVVGFDEAFQFLSKWHIIRQLGIAAFLLWVWWIDNGEFQERIYETVKKTERKFLHGDLAWRNLCQEYGVDPDHLIEGLPTYGILEFVKEIIVDIQGCESNLSDYQAVLDDYRDAIEYKRKEWD